MKKNLETAANSSNSKLDGAWMIKFRNGLMLLNPKNTFSLGLAFVLIKSNVVIQAVKFTSYVQVRKMFIESSPN